MLKACGVRTCPNLVRGKNKYCPTHAYLEYKNDKHYRGSASERGYDRNWNKLRDAYLSAHPICEECGERIAEMVHHIEPIKNAKDKKLNIDNLEALCLSCHAKIHRAPPIKK